MNPFDFVKSILSTKNHLMDQDSSNEKEYVPYLVNRSLSYHYDCLSYAQEMNQRSLADKRMQYDYLYHTIRSKRRPFHKWIKPEVHTTIETIQQVFGYSKQRAQEAMAILTPDQMLTLMQRLDKGGLNRVPKTPKP